MLLLKHELLNIRAKEILTSKAYMLLLKHELLNIRAKEILPQKLTRCC
jgi:hypothetical protein